MTLLNEGRLNPKTHTVAISSDQKEQITTRSLKRNLLVKQIPADEQHQDYGKLSHCARRRISPEEMADRSEAGFCGVQEVAPTYYLYYIYLILLLFLIYTSNIIIIIIYLVNVISEHPGISKMAANLIESIRH